MGFGGGAFGTGSYVYSVIDNLTIKLDAISGVIYANNGTSQGVVAPINVNSNNQIYLDYDNITITSVSGVLQLSPQMFVINNNTTANAGVGYETLASLIQSEGEGNSALGYQTLTNTTSGKWNVAIGAYSGQDNTTGNYNIIIGEQALQKNTTGGVIIAIGSGAMATFNNTAGTNNNIIAIGWEAGISYTGSETNNICIGSTGVAGETDTVRLGSLIVGNQSTGVLSTPVITSSYAWVQGKNRQYEQALTPQTTTSTSATLLGSSISITPKFSGYLVITLVVRGNNNTVADGITIGIYQGASSGALTTLLDSDTYTQEGAASNSHTFVLHYELSGQTIGTATYISAAFNAITGGTASAKIVDLSVQEV